MLFTWWVPETKGKTLEEIVKKEDEENYLLKKKQVNYEKGTLLLRIR